MGEEPYYTLAGQSTWRMLYVGAWAVSPESDKQKIKPFYEMLVDILEDGEQLAQWTQQACRNSPS